MAASSDLERNAAEILDGVPETLAYLTERHGDFIYEGEPRNRPRKWKRQDCKDF